MSVLFVSDILLSVLGQIDKAFMSLVVYIDIGTYFNCNLNDC